MVKGKNLVGERYGLLTVIEKTGKTDPRRGYIYLCRCDCGNEKEVPTIYLTRGSTRSCGCLVKSPRSERKVTEKSPKYKIPEKLNDIKSEVVADGKLIVFENGEIYRKTKYGEKKCAHYKQPIGYSTVSATVDGRQKHFYVHRLLAEAFIDNPENKPQVNHKDGDKGNNDLSNLEWVTASENARHAHYSGLVDVYKNGEPCDVCSKITNAKDRICTTCKSKINAAEKYKERTNERINKLKSIDIDILSPSQKETVNLALKGLSVTEISEILDKSKQYVSKTLKDACEPKVKKFLKSDKKELDRISKKIRKKELKLELLELQMDGIKKEIEMLKSEALFVGGFENAELQGVQP